MTGKTTPLYVVCSPCRCVGKTLVSRLLTEFYVANDRSVAAFDLADEGPQLADYLPEYATIADIGDIRGQMALFERLIAEKDTPRVIDVSHRAFKNFFTVVQEISFFEEARCRSIEPLGDRCAPVNSPLECRCRPSPREAPAKMNLCRSTVA